LRLPLPLQLPKSGIDRSSMTAGRCILSKQRSTGGGFDLLATSRRRRLGDLRDKVRLALLALPWAINELTTCKVCKARPCPGSYSCRKETRLSSHVSQLRIPILDRHRAGIDAIQFRLRSIDSSSDFQFVIPHRGPRPLIEGRGSH
jgi:hypothetical protein